MVNVVLLRHHLVDLIDRISNPMIGWNFGIFFRRIAHVGAFEALEAEMMAFDQEGRAGGHSPDRLDALVWAVTDLMAGPAAPAQYS